MSKTNLGMIAYAKEKEQLTKQGKVIYILGGIGRVLTDKMISDRIKAGCAHTRANESRLRKAVGRYAFDCNALMKSYLWETEPGKIRYNASQDLGVRSLWTNATEKGKFNTMPDLPGVMVFTATLTHVGIYIGKNANGEREYLEATPAFGIWGVGRTTDKMRKWDAWGKYHLVEYVEPKPEPAPQPSSGLKKGTKVRWSGRLYRDSMGNGATGSYRERDGIIDIINDNKYGVHIRNMGWIMPSQIKETRDAVYHTVQRGETLWGIGKKYNVKWNEIYKNNKTIIGRTPSLIKPGMRLFIK